MSIVRLPQHVGSGEVEVKASYTAASEGERAHEAQAARPQVDDRAGRVRSTPCWDRECEGR